MKKQVWKFALDIQDKQIIKMPVGSEILSVQTQNDNPCIWALVNPESVSEKRMFEIFMTGEPIHFVYVPRKHIGTFQIKQGLFVYHLFETF